MTNVVFATCNLMPAMQPDDAPLAEALQARGANVSVAPWNGPFEPFAAADVVAVRSPWDYPEHWPQFLEWLDRLEEVDAVTGNSPELMRWNARKDYLPWLAERGAPLPPTVVVEPDADAILRGMNELGLSEAVVKPLFGAGASGLTIVRADDRGLLVEAAAALQGEGLLQPLIPEIRTLGETSLTFFGGEFSHAVVKRPAAESILVQAEHGGSTAAVEPPAAAIESAREVLAMLPQQPLYARVDMVLTEQRALLMEVELIEPELFMLHGEGSADRFAELMLADSQRR